MRTSSTIACALLGLALVLFPGCVELEGQRISIYFDEALDKLFLLILYDGIHESSPAMMNSKNGADQIPEFVENGDIMLLDWLGHLSKEAVLEGLENPEAPPAVRALCEAFLSDVKTHVLGRYRHFNGHMGAAQLVVISKAKSFIKKVNEAVSAGILADEPDPEGEEYPLLMTAVREAAREGMDWVSIEGQALCITVPVHPREWACCKAEFLKGDLFGLEKEEAGRAAQTLFAAPLSYMESRGRVTLRIGDPLEPSTFRFPLRETYNNTLEATVAEHVPDELDLLLAGEILVEPEPHPFSQGLDALITWGPPEEKVRALVRAAAAEGASEAAHKAALEWLSSFGKAWNENEAVPAAPLPGDDLEAFLEAWKAWYGQMIRFPQGDPP